MSKDRGYRPSSALQALFSVLVKRTDVTIDLW